MSESPKQLGTRMFTGYCRHCDRKVKRPLPTKQHIINKTEVQVFCYECDSVIPCTTKEQTSNPANV